MRSALTSDQYVFLQLARISKMRKLLPSAGGIEFFPVWTLSFFKLQVEIDKDYRIFSKKTLPQIIPAILINSFM